ncbi:MAG TPA: hypothetical protein VGF32_10475 [Streptosporangiaceae bacterium]
MTARTAPVQTAPIQTAPIQTAPVPTAIARDTERLHVDHAVAKRLGRWTSANQFDARVRYGVLVLDLRSPDVKGDVEVRLDLQRSTLKLLLAEGDQVDHRDLDWTGRGRVRDDQRPANPGGRIVRLTGHADSSEVRVHRGGMAALSAMFSRAYVQDLRRARKNGGYPTVDDPTRAAR